MIAAPEHVAQLGRGHAGAHREPAAERLRRGDHVRANRELLVGPQRPGPPHPGLDLVEDQERARVVAGLARGEQHLVGDRKDPRLALDRLDHHRGGALADRGAQRAGVVARHRHEARRQRPEQVLAGEPRRRRQRPERAAVEGAIEDDDLRRIDAPPVRVLARPA